MSTFGKPWSINDLAKHLKQNQAARVSKPAVKPPRKAAEVTSLEKTYESISLTIKGQIRGGKNNYIVTRKGKHIPKEAWAVWRDEKLAEVRNQLPQDWIPISSPCRMELYYWTGDKKRRDMPAILDSIFHILEKAGVVMDDTLLWVERSNRAFSKENPQAQMELSFYR